MTAPQPPAAPVAPAAQIDPTNVMGKRIGAFFIDLVIVCAAFFVPFIALAESIEVPGMDADPEIEFRGGQVGIISGDNVFIFDTWEFWAVVVVGFGTGIVIHWIIAGLKGVTPGKLAVGIIVVDEAGQVPGVPKAILRNLMYVVDAAPYFVPYLVGLIVALASKGHRRVGDMVARTYVVDRAWAGYPVPVAPASGPAPPPAAPAAAQWDPRRDAWVQWDPAQQQWLQWSEDDQRWGPLS